MKLIFKKKPLLFFSLLLLTVIQFSVFSQPLRRSYISSADGSTQPYWVYLPPHYSSKKKYPLVVFLHGYDPEITQSNPWLPGEEIWSVFTNAGLVLAVPYGRSNTDFVDIGEDDVVAVRREMLQHFSIDSDQVFLMGVSMGAYGAYVDALHRPELWDGVAAISGRTDFYHWFDLDRDNLPDWQKVLFDANDPRHLALNASGLPIYIQHGAWDNVVPVQHSRLFVTDLEELGYQVRYQEYPHVGHYLYFEYQPFQKIVDWFKTLPAASASLRKISFTTGTLRDGKNRWVRITAFNRYDQLSSINVQVEENIIEVTSSNVAGFELTPPKVLFAGHQEVRLSVNGALLPQKYVSGQKIIYPKKQPPQSFPGYKTAQRSGPVKACFRDPFMVVYGTGNSEDESKARKFIRQWQRYSDGVPPLKSDKDISANDCKKYNLAIFGTPNSNSLLAKIASKLPIKFKEDGYQLGQKYFSGKDVGVIFCYPSPFSTQRMIVVQSGLYWGKALPVNHKWDLLPDYMIYNSTIDNYNSHLDAIKTNKALAAGFFDHHWK